MNHQPQAETGRRNAQRGPQPGTEPGPRHPGPSPGTAGLRATTRPLDPEDHAATRANRWHDHYRPTSPGAIHLVNEAARATLLADRCDRYMQATLERQVEETTRLFHHRCRRQLAEQLRKLKAD